MRKVLMALAILTIPAAAFGMAATPSDKEIEAKAEAVIPRASLKVVDADAQAIVDARKAGKSTAAEIKATGGYQTAATNAFYAAAKARTALNVSEFDRQAAIAKTNRDKACAILSGC